MEYEWDEGKNEANIAKGRADFASMEYFEWETAKMARSDRHSEIRWTAVGYIGNRLHHMVFTERNDRIRIISLRIASKQEVREYAET